LFLEVSKLETSGKPPLARYMHKSIFFSNKYLLIHGGRNNNEAYEDIRNVGLNDIALLNVHQK
jgi:hypothetical protein